MASPGIITFTTDFGASDSFVGQMKGAALSIDPDLRLIDLCHEIPAQNVAAGAYVLETGYGAFPRGTVHVAVVDPGVGTSRRAVAVAAGGHVFVAPDNGLLGRVLGRERPECAVELEPAGPGGAATFEGRDRFTPAAARIASGTPVESMGPLARDLVVLPVAARPEPDRFASIPVIHVDRFGNAVLDLRAEWIGAGSGTDDAPAIVVRTPGGEIDRLHRTYGEAEGDSPFLVVNSAGYVEIAVNGRDAADRLGLRPGDTLDVRLGS
jgi:S-adenosylmethionine hydrolase